MKLEAYDVIIDGKRFRCFTRDAGFLRKKKVVLESGAIITARDWKYHGPMEMSAREDPLVGEIIKRVKADGLVVTAMPDIPTLFYVFDIRFDSGDARVYSSDPNLAEFNRLRRQLELGVDADKWLGDEPVLKGEVEIESKVAAMRMGVEYDSLISRGFWVTVLREITVKEHMERSVLRKLREKAKDLGVFVEEFQITSITPVKPHDADKRESHILARPPQMDGVAAPHGDASTIATRENLRTQFEALRDTQDPQKRGYELENILNELFALEDLRPRGPFRITGEQIDGSFVWHSRTYLLEAKWTRQPAAGAQLGAFNFKLDGKTADTRGIFVSIDGFSTDGLAALRTKGNLKFVCLDGEHLAAALTTAGTLTDILEQVWRHADETGEAYIRASELQM